MPFTIAAVNKVNNTTAVKMDARCDNVRQPAQYSCLFLTSHFQESAVDVDQCTDATKIDLTPVTRNWGLLAIAHNIGPQSKPTINTRLVPLLFRSTSFRGRGQFASILR